MLVKVKDFHKPITFKRRFSEIEWLHKNLIKSCVGCKIFSLPEKNFFTNTLLRNDMVIMQRKDQIQKYLNYVNNHKYLSKSEYFLQFISNSFELKKNEIQRKRSYFDSFKNYISNGI